MTDKHEHQYPPYTAEEYSTTSKVNTPCLICGEYRWPFPRRTSYKIQIVDWPQRGFRGLPYTHGQEIEGDEKDAFRIARECFDVGLNVMVTRSHSAPGDLIGYRVSVDDRSFQCR